MFIRDPKQANSFIGFAPVKVSLIKNSLYISGVAFYCMVFLGISTA